ncbi:VWA-like domain-containing protein [Sulfitobacter sp. HNIBRBA3233]|uniref:vWA domain-containing protein n=1 Tax=Sulfitobacter marinivivus TaxID=3158558 RepID=UPI0032E04FDB
MSDVHSARAAPALQALAEYDPAIAALSLWCVHRDGPRTATAGDRITYGPEFEGMPAHEQRGLAAHHILHVALRHSARADALAARLGPAFDDALFNLAADALVNEAVLAGDHALPRPAVTLTGLLREVRGDDLSGVEALGAWDVERLYFALASSGSEGQGQKQEGRAQHYARTQEFAQDLDRQSGNPDAEGDVQDSARWRQHITRAMDAGRAAGRGIGRIGHRLADVPAPRVPWEVILRRLLSQAVMQAPRVHPARPARRWIAAAAQADRAGTPVPGFEPGRRPVTDVPRIAIAVDASSSVDNARLSLFWAEVSGIARRMRAEVHLMVFDDAIRHRARLDPAASQMPLPDLPRGGGTAFPPVIAEARALGAAALVILTDLEGDAGPAPRNLRVIWAADRPQVAAPPFGQVIDLSA